MLTTRQLTHRVPGEWERGPVHRCLSQPHFQQVHYPPGTGTWGHSEVDILGVARVWKSPYWNSHIGFSSVPACSCLLGGSRAADAPSLAEQEPRGGYGGNFGSRVGLILEEALGVGQDPWHIQPGSNSVGALVLLGSQQSAE